MCKFPRFTLLLFLGITFFACEQFSKTETTNVSDKIVETKNNVLTENSFRINGTSFTTDDTYVYLYKAEGKTYTLIDSTFINNNHFTFDGSVDLPTKYRVSLIRNKNKGFSFLVDNSEINVFLNRRTDFSTAHSLSNIQKEYSAYTSQMNTFKDRGMSLYYGLQGDFSSENIKKLRKGRLKLFSEQNEYIQNFIKEHSNSHFAAMLVNDNFNTYDAKTLRSLYNGLSSEVRDLAYTKTIDSLITIKESEIEERLPVVVAKKVEESYKGEYRPKAYKISGNNPYGEAMSLNSIPKGKVILVDFWASWCAPCRATNPNLVQLYNKYNSQGFEILSVSEDKGEAEWMNAIAVDNLTWDYHVIDKNKTIAFRYGVESIPFKLLIDKNGNIASEKISGRALESRIIELLAE